MTKLVLVAQCLFGCQFYILNHARDITVERISGRQFLTLNFHPKFLKVRVKLGTVAEPNFLPYFMKITLPIPGNKQWQPSAI